MTDNELGTTQIKKDSESGDRKLKFYRESITDTMKQKPFPGELKSIVIFSSIFSLYNSI